MNQEFFEAKELVELVKFKSYLAKLNIESIISPKTDSDDISILTIELIKNLTLSILFIPLPSDQLSQISLLQFYAIINENVDASKSELNSLLIHVNEKTGLGSCTINHENELVFKYVLAKSKNEELTEIFFIELLAIITPAIENHYITLNEYIQGVKSLEEAISSLE